MDCYKQGEWQKPRKTGGEGNEEKTTEATPGSGEGLWAWGVVSGGVHRLSAESFLRWRVFSCTRVPQGVEGKVAMKPA